MEFLPRLRLRQRSLLFAFSLILLFLDILIPPATSKTNQEPVNVGFIFSLPWDISNTLRAPLAGPLSIVLAASLAMICFAGMAFAPLWYIFGFPKRNYYMHTIPRENSKDVGGRRSLEEEISWETLNSSTTTTVYPDFVETMFLFVPDGEVEEDCKKLMVCHAHGFLSILPESWVRIIRFFSRKILHVPENYKVAITKGLEDQGSCIQTFTECSQDIVSIAKKTLFHNIPENVKDWLKLEMQ